MIRRCGLLVTVCLLLTCAASAQRVLIVEDTGVLRIKDGDGIAASIEVNCHGPEWTLGTQSEGVAQIQRVSDTETLITGRVPVAGTTDGAIVYEQRLTQGDDGMVIAYWLGFSGPMAIHNLQVSELLPAELYAGSRLEIAYGDTGRRQLLLPAALDAAQWVLGTFKGHAITTTPIDGEPVTFSGAEDKMPGFEIYDLRQWERDEFEVRVPLLSDQEGKLVGKDDHFGLTLTLPGEYELQID